MAKQKKPSNNQQNKKIKEMEKKRKQQTWVIMASTLVVLILVVLIVGIVMQNKQKSEANPSKTPSASNGTSLNSTSTSVIQYNNEPEMGSANAPVKIAEFGDYKCPVCRQFEMTIFPQLKKDYIDTGKVDFYFMNYPIIAQDSITAANASETIYEEHPDDFWTFHELLYQNQGDETKNWVTEDLLVKLAKQAVPSLDEKPFRWSIAQTTYKDQVNRDYLMGQRAGVQGTPSLFINGVMTNNTFNYEALKKEIDQAIEKGKD